MSRALPTSHRIHLQYRIETESGSVQAGQAIDNPLFEMLSALAAEGSIQGAARRLTLSYRHLWGRLKDWEALLGQTLVTWQRGQPARLTAYAERLMWAERQARSRLAPHIEALRSELQCVLADAADASQQVLRIEASHDLMLPPLQSLAAEQHLHLALRFAGSLDALRSLAEGRCTVAGFHVPPTQRDSVYARALKARLKPGRHKLIGAMRRCQGLMVASGNPFGVRSLVDVARKGLRFAAREPGAGTRLLAEHLAKQQGMTMDELHISATETGHLAAATAVARGAADAALGLEAAASRLGLGFVPLIEEDYFLACLNDVIEHPAVLALRRVLSSARWQQALRDETGYAPAEAPGVVLSLTRALPWWTFREPRP